jgi:cytochrome c5
LIDGDDASSCVRPLFHPTPQFEDSMSDASHTPGEENHEGPIKTPKQLITAVVFSFVIPVLVIVLLAVFVTSSNKPVAGSDGLDEKAILARIQPVAKVVVKDASAPVVLKTGAEVYTGRCAACHTGGLAGSPKLGDTAAWAPRIQQGYDTLLNSALKGKNAMGAQGGGDYSDLEIARAVVYLTNQSGAQFAEPKAPEAAASGAAAASDAQAASAPAMAASK